MVSQRLMGWRLSPQSVDPVIDRHWVMRTLASSSIAEFIPNVLAGGRAYSGGSTSLGGCLWRIDLALNTSVLSRLCPSFPEMSSSPPSPPLHYGVLSVSPPPHSSAAESSEPTSPTKLCLLQLIYLGYFCHNGENLVKTAPGVKRWRKTKDENHGKHIHFLFVHCTNHAQVNFLFANGLLCYSYHSHQMLAHEDGMMTLHCCFLCPEHS